MCLTVVFHLGHVIDKLPFHEPMGVVDVDRFALDIHARTRSTGVYSWSSTGSILINPEAKRCQKVDSGSQM